MLRKLLHALSIAKQRQANAAYRAYMAGRSPTIWAREELADDRFALDRGLLPPQ
jgi:hypothetical protein